MTSALKTAIAATAFFAATAAHADWQFGSGSATLTFAQDGLDTLDASGAYIMTEGAGNKATYDEGKGTIALVFTGGTTTGDDIKTLTSPGSSVLLQRTVAYGGKYSKDNLITLRDFVFDLGSRTLSAHVTGTELLYTHASTDYGFLPIFTADAVLGGQVGGLDGFATEGSLRMSEATANAFLTILQLPLSGTLSDMFKNGNWGTLSGTATFTSTIPEPSTVCLGLIGGLAMLSAVRARRQQPSA